MSKSEKTENKNSTRQVDRRDFLRSAAVVNLAAAPSLFAPWLFAAPSASGATVLNGAFGSRKHVQWVQLGGFPEVETLMQEFLVGTYTGGRSLGVYSLSLDLRTGQLKQNGLQVETQQPSFLAMAGTDKKQFLAVGETNAESENGGTLSLFADNGGKFKLLDQQSTLGAHPCHLDVNQAGTEVVVANYSGGSYTAYQLNENKLSEGSCYQNSGSGPNRQRQEGPHGHCVRFLPGDNDHLLAADLGTDQVLLFRLNREAGKVALDLVSQLPMTAGAGPRQIDFHPNGKWFYVINELNSTMAQVSMPDAEGKMEVLHLVSTLPEGFKGNNSTAHLQVHPSGKFLYGSNRGDDSIAIFKLDATSGKHTLIGHRKTGGRTPRHFVIDPSGKYLLAANQDSDNVVAFSIDPESGKLSESIFQAYAPRPVCLRPVL